MAPRSEIPKATPKVQRTIKANPAKGKASPVGIIKKSMSARKNAEKIPTKVINTEDSRQRTNTVPKVATPKPKENKSVPLPSSMTKSAKKALWKRRPKPAHSGVPLPEKMKRLKKHLEDPDCSL